MNTTINDRIREILDTLYRGNTTAMAKGTFIKRTTIQSIVSPQEVTPGYDVLKKIAEISAHRISMEWLIRGEGNMILDASQGGNSAVASGDSSIAVNNNNGSISHGEVQALNNQIAMMKQLLEEKERTIQILLNR